jgi:preprotein translocase subunit SecY
VITNIIPDYLSLVESRFVLGKMSETRSLLGKIVWLIVDAFLTAAIVFFFLWGSGLLLLPLVPQDSLYVVGCLTQQNFDFARMLDIVVAGLTFSTPPGTINYDVSSIYIFSSFFTSFWVWLYLGSSLLVRLAALIPGLRGFLRRACRVEDYPLRVLAVVSGLVAVMLTLLPPLLRPLLPEQRQGTNGMDGNIGQIELCREWDRETHPWHRH